MFCTALFLFVLLFGDHALSIVSVHIEESFLLCYKTKLAAFQKKKKANSLPSAYHFYDARQHSQNERGEALYPS